MSRPRLQTYLDMPNHSTTNFQTAWMNNSDPEGDFMYQVRPDMGGRAGYGEEAGTEASQPIE